jgi:two-component system, NarL family, sensor kinase
MKQLFLIVAMAIAALTVSGQTAWTRERDSLLKLLSISKEDSNKAMVLTYLGLQYQYNQQDSAVYYLKDVYKLSVRIHYVRGIVNSLTVQAGILSDQDKQDEAIALDSEAIAIATKAHYKKGLAAIYNNIAIPYKNKGDYATCIDYYLKAASLDEELHDDYRLAMAYANIGGAYNGMKEFKQGYAYSLKGLLLARSLDHMSAEVSGTINLAGALIPLKRYDTALVVLNDAKELAKKLNDYSTADGALNDICAIYVETAQPELLKNNATELLRFARSVNDQQGICFGLANLSDYFFAKKEYGQAKTYSQQLIKLAAQERLSQILRSAYQGAAKIDLVQGNVAGYDHYTNLKDSIDARMLSDKILKNTQELEAKYFLNKKQAEIDDLTKQQKINQLTLRQRNTINWVLAGLVLVVALIGLLYRRNYKQKKKLLLADTMLQQQRISELEKEKQLLAVQAVLQGQVEERTRLAKDLHDGLGSILSSAKYSFTNMKENLIITQENAEAFEKSMGMLDKSITELRRVAHNMMPEALMKFGLDTALKDFCSSVDQSGAVQLTYQSFEMQEASIPAIVSSAVYRIIQELVNNILKHADATTALVQLIRKDNTLSITVEDNGKGFDTGILQNITGIGYLNLRNRVAYLNGTIDIQTAPGKGTSVNIEIANIAA